MGRLSESPPWFRGGIRQVSGQRLCLLVFCCLCGSRWAVGGRGRASARGMVGPGCGATLSPARVLSCSAPSAGSLRAWVPGRWEGRPSGLVGEQTAVWRLSRYGCCPDGVSVAEGPWHAGCAGSYSSDNVGRRPGSRAVAFSVSVGHTGGRCGGAGIQPPSLLSATVTQAVCNLGLGERRSLPAAGPQGF